MTTKRGEVCEVCGMGGYWVAYSPAVDEVRCINHIDNEDGTADITGDTMRA